MKRLGVDTGGTFTDFVMVDEERRIVGVGKQLSTPGDPAVAVLEGTAALLSLAGISLREVQDFVLGTTLPSNLILERKGVGTVLIATKGFRDVLLIGREKRADVYDLGIDKPRPLVRRRDIYEVDERILSDGRIARPLDVDGLRRLANLFLEKAVLSVAVCLVNAYANGVHERQVRDILQRVNPQLLVSISSEVAPQWREYERTSTTVVNAYVMPAVRDYIGKLSEQLSSKGLPRGLLVMQSNGGVAGSGAVLQFPVRLVESGPAAGAIMAAQLGAAIGEPNVLALDIGGTTAKLCLIHNGVPTVTDTFEVDQARLLKLSGLPISVPAIDLIEIGAGGGSIARVSNLGLVTVGPDSSGARPGPACYGRGGTDPTVTDADLLLGYLNPRFFAGGAFDLDLEAAARAVFERIAKPLRISTIQAAWAIHEVVNSNMIAAARTATVERGIDPRRCALVAFGGAGPVHAARLASGLGIRNFVIPFAAGVASAVGLLSADVKFDLVRTFRAPVSPETIAPVEELYAEMERLARQMVSETVGDERASTCQLQRSADLRYIGQGYEIRVPILDSPLTSASAAKIRDDFNVFYKTIYGSSDSGEIVEAVNWRLEARLRGAGVVVQPPPVASRGASLKGRRRVYFPETGGLTDCPIYDRYLLEPGDMIQGPAIIEEKESSSIVLPGQTASIDRLMNIRVAAA